MPLPRPNNRSSDEYHSGRAAAGLSGLIPLPPAVRPSRDLVNLRPPALAFLVACVLLPGCGGDDQPSPAVTNSAASGNPIMAPVDYLGAVGKAKSAAERTIDTAGISRAIQTFHAGEGRFPATLGELVSEGYLPRLPEPPTGQQFVYDSRDGSFKVAPRP